MLSPGPDSSDRLSLIFETQREIARAGSDLQAVMQLVAERSQAITGADGAMVNLIDGAMLHTRAVSGIAAGVLDARRPTASSIAKYAIESGQALLIEDAPSDPRINQELRAVVGDQSLICVPLFRGGEVIGTLNVMSISQTERLDEGNRQTLAMLSVVLSAAVSHAAEFEARRGQAEALARFRTLFEGVSIGILRLGRDGRAVEANPALEQMLGYSAAEFGEMILRDYIHADDLHRAEELFRELMLGRVEAFQLEARYSRKDGELVWGQVSAALERDGDGAPAFAVTMIENITKRKHAEEELARQAELSERQALHDPLTGLPNRLLFDDRIERAIAHAERNGTPLAVVMLDLDRFKEVNDSLGHTAGDELLATVGERLRDALREADTAARLGGDEFGILLPDCEGIVTAVERIRGALAAPISVQDLPLSIEASIGIALYPDHGHSSDLLIQRADAAMYTAKREGSHYAFYEGGSDEGDRSRIAVTRELRRALEEHELVLHFQPRVQLADGSVSSVEALVRWQHPTRGLLQPGAFIPAAQETGLIRPLTLAVLGEALRQCRVWRDEGLGLAVSVNLSTRNLLDLDFPARVAELLAAHGLEPCLLELELTESAMLANPKRTTAVLEELSALGVKLALDDFGTGYSSLAFLRHLPIDEIKIDRSFVMDMWRAAADLAIVRCTVDLGLNLGLGVVAEGVETREVCEQLAALGCTSAQGFHFSPALPPEQLGSWLRAHRASADATYPQAA
jgi:diguanylate cyclase (GGDEF)-like protein/PAS domain S-box-containing protein